MHIEKEKGESRKEALGESSKKEGVRIKEQRESIEQNAARNIKK